MTRRVDMRPAAVPLEPTYSRAEVMAFFGIRATALWRLMQDGLHHKGPHGLRGGLWPWFRPTHKCVRITKTAIDRHVEHMQRIESDPMFRAQQSTVTEPRAA